MVLWFWFSPTRFSGLERKRISLHRLLVLFAFACKAKRFVISSFFLLPNLSGISGNSEQKNYLQTIEQLIIQLFVAIKEDFWFIFFWAYRNKGKFLWEISQRLLNKCSYLFICIWLNRHCQQKHVGMVSANNVERSYSHQIYKPEQ